jgi:hypothetical protein
MFTSQIQPTDVVYNPADQTFDATVTLYDKGAARRYACAIDAPITMSFDDAAKGLRTKALRLHTNNAGLTSVMASRAGKPTSKSRFALKGWVHAILNSPGTSAA